MYLFIICISGSLLCVVYFFFNDTATTEIYTLSLHDALPISRDDLDPAARAGHHRAVRRRPRRRRTRAGHGDVQLGCDERSEEHTSELQSRRDLVCRLLLEKKKKTN